MPKRTVGDQGVPTIQRHDKPLKRWEYRLKRLLLKLLRFVAGTSKPSARPLGPESKVLFIRLNRIGDALISTALIHAVKERLGCIVHVYAGTPNRFIFENHPEVSRVYTYGKKLGDLWRFRQMCRSERYDAVVDCHDDVSTTVSYLVALSGAAYRIGLYRPANHQVFTHTYPRTDPASTHVLDRLLQLTQAFGFIVAREQANVYYPIRRELREAARGSAQTLFTGPGLRVGVNLTAGSPARFWGVQNFQKLVPALQTAGCQVVLMGLPGDKAAATQIAPDVPFYANPDFMAFSALIPELNLLFTPDTSLVHVASAYHVPVAGLYVYMNTQLMYWYPYRSPYVAITTAAPTLSELTFEEVWAQLAPFLHALKAQETLNN